MAGCLGSGKTELAINYALSTQPLSVLADVDVINPYFRSRLVKSELEKQGLTLISSEGLLANADLPALSPRIRSIFDNPGRPAVFDVGGDDVGAKVLGRFVPFLPEGSYDLFFVLNTCRPFTQDCPSIIKMFQEIQAACGLKFTGLINNTNLGQDTDLAIIAQGRKIILEAAAKLNLPLVFTGAAENLAAGLPEIPYLPLKFYMRPPF
ncbi:MAG: hypothetical protein MJ157_05680 [Clostridia bacterium]|nr:hypothetical protein [Clostridia bacterium]